MKKTQTDSGENAFLISIKVVLTRKAFAIALGEQKYQYEESLDLQSLTKKKAEQILRRRLEWHGKDGAWQGMEGVGDEHQEEYNACYDEALAWVDKHYPFLNNQR